MKDKESVSKEVCKNCGWWQELGSFDICGSGRMRCEIGGCLNKTLTNMLMGRKPTTYFDFGCIYYKEIESKKN